jgi:general secretion pathway protein L
MSRQILSIDIRNNSIAAVVLNAGLKSHTIASCTYIPLPDAPNRLSAGLAVLKENTFPANPTVVVSLPADRAIFRTIFVPFKEEKKIRQVLPFELEPNLPVPVDDLIIDYYKGGQPEKSGLLTTAVDRLYLEEVMDALTAVNLRPQLVVPGGIPLALGLTSYQPLDHQALLLDVGPRRTILVALNDNNIAMLRSMPSDLSSETAVEALALRIRQTLTAFADNQPGGFTPKTLYMSGPAMADKVAGPRLAKALDMALQDLDLRSLAPKVDAASIQDQWKPFLFDNALALALIEVEGRCCPSFHRSTSSFRKFWTTYKPYLQVPAVLMAFVLLLGLSGVLIESHFLKKRVDGIDANIEALFAATFPNTRRVEKTPALNQMKSELQKSRSNMDSGQTDFQVRTIDILFQLSQSIPKEIDVVFSRLVLGSDGLSISGETAAFNIVDEIKNGLEKSDLFKQVTIASANMDRSGKIQFKLKIDL